MRHAILRGSSCQLDLQGTVLRKPRASLALLAALATANVLLSAEGASSATELKDSVAQYGITWKFDKKVPVGTFVNGDYYVVGPVTVVEVAPAPSGAGKGFRNGSMLNPPVTSFSAYDGRFPNNFRQELAAKYPLELKPGDSLVSVISLEKGQPISKLPGNEAGLLKAAAVLTCLKDAVPSNSFRPGYCDQKKDLIHRTTEIRWDLLPTAIALAAAKNKPTWSWEELERAFERPWLDHVYSWESRELHPAENMPGYGQQVVRVVSMAALLLCSDAPRERKTKLCQGMIQVGIDNWAIATRGKTGEAGGWPAQGGFGSGRKFPIIFAAIMLQQQEMLQLGKNAPETAFGEDQHTEFGRCWSGACVRFAGQFPLSGIAERGPYENLWPGLWPGPGRTMSEGYRRANTSNSWVGEALAALLMKADKIWDHSAFFAYVDRWMYEDDGEQVRILRDTLDADYNKDWCRQTHTFDDDLVEELWAKYRRSAGMPPVAEFRKEFPEEDRRGEEPRRVKIGPQREFLVNGQKIFPLMLFAQAKAQVPNARALGASLVNGKIPPDLFAQADLHVQDALALGANTVFVNGDAGVDTWAFHYGKEFLAKIAEKGLYGVLGADTEVFGHPRLLGLTHEDQPDRPFSVIPGPPWPKKISVVYAHPTHNGPPKCLVDGDTRSRMVIDPADKAEVTIKLGKPVTASSLAVWISPEGSTTIPKDVEFLADGKEILKATLKQQEGKQEFKLEKPATFVALLFRVLAVYPGKVEWGFVNEIEAFDEKGQRVWLYDYDPQLRSVEKVADLYNWMTKMQRTRPVFLTLSSGLMPSSSMWDKEAGALAQPARQTIYPGYIRNCDVAGFLPPPDSAGRGPEWLNRVAEGVSALRALAGSGRPVVFWLEVPPGEKVATGGTPVVPRASRSWTARAAIWNAIIHGATAIGYRTAHDKNQMIMDDEMRATLKELNERIAGLAQAILGPPAHAKIEMTMSGGLVCHCKATESDGSVFVFAQNLGTGKEEAGGGQTIAPRGGKATIHVAGLPAGASVEVVGEKRTITAPPGQFDDDFAPMAEHIYKLKM